MLLSSIIRLRPVENRITVGWRFTDDTLEIIIIHGIMKQVSVHIVQGVGCLQLSPRKRNLVWISNQRVVIEEMKKRDELKIRKELERRRVPEITVEKFLLGARLMSVAEK
jgi:hypothetical protein